ncbi:aminoglycoside phosphotransferase family protein [Dongia deserti]|uniref:aminoglycoside phosphotransferase family protein n=1 Tax=Dongia deserti TaxID=2268030 RepID=UPI002548C6E2|nr:phosphotransferase [Dongia deserti]
MTPINRTEREQHIAAFLKDAGWGAAQRGLLAGDASFRRYDRLNLNGKTAVLMDAPPPMENVGPFINVARLLGGLGFSTPRILAQDHARGLLLLEDLGDDTYTMLLRQGRDERPLYELATDALIEVRRRVPQGALKTLPVFDEARCLREVSLLLDWYWPAIKGAPAPDAVRAEFEAAWRAVLPGMWKAGRTITLFDFHVDNLLVLPDRSGFQACGLLDFQDAVAGPVPFDLASLLEDVRRQVPQDLASAMIDRYLTGNPDLNAAAFRSAYALSAAQRNTRIAGTFTRLLKRDNKPNYQRFMPRVWELLQHDIAHPALAPVKAWFDKHLAPAERRPVLDVQ